MSKKEVYKNRVGAVIVNNSKRVIRIGGINIFPSENVLNAEKVKVLSSNEIYLKMLENNKNLVVDIVESDGNGFDGIKDFLSGNVKDISSSVKEIFDISTLEELLEAEAEGEDRATVVSAIEKQIAEIKTPALGTN